jgi:AAA+ superfamily predicted ATPase
MLFYKIDVDLQCPAEDVDKNEKSERANALQSKIELHFEKQEYNCHIAVVNLIDKKQKAALCAAVKTGALTEQTVGAFLADADLINKSFSVREITLESYLNLLHTSYRNDFISDDSDVSEKLNISDLDGRHNHREIHFSETIVLSKRSQKNMLAMSAGMLCADSLTVEINRIFQGANALTLIGHPVHYILQVEARDTRDKILQILIAALYQNNRLQSRRYCSVSFDGNDYLPDSYLNTLYESCAGGTMVVSFGDEDSADGEYARTGADVIVGLCDAMRKHKNSVLTIFCLPKSCELIKDVFMEHLGAVTEVVIQETAAFHDRAKEYLKSVAKHHGATPDRNLYRQIKSDEGYSAKDLNIIFETWYDRQLKTKIYSQYACLETANKQIASKKPKGSAYADLEKMVGLSEAKKTINEILDFYKAQKLFKDKGIAVEHPAMHMIFTGNPGSAKTTVARLLAQIMKENDLLSVRDLFEVGRADLVGKYVGSTAPIVKQKFRAAKGSVLFIDEAYSLVDDRDGLYGDEAINTIVQEMENNREDMVVIFAGYPDKMERFLQKNPGLRSRIAFHVPFADYNADELFDITSLMAGNKKLKLCDGVREKLLPIYETAAKTGDFGNGRFVRNMFEKAVMKQAARLVSMDVDIVTKDDIRTLLAEDFEAPPQKPQIKNRIGFAG